MAFESVLSQMGSGMKHLTDRYAEYGAPVVQDQQMLYAYEPPAHSHEADSKHNYSSGNKNNAAMSALTLLAFLFFLHILQQCIKDHMTAMSTPQITIMTAGREGEDTLKNTNGKIDKTGITSDSESKVNSDIKHNFHLDEIHNEDKNTYLMKINTAEPPKNGIDNYMYTKDHTDKRLVLSGFVNAMEDM